MENQTEKQMEHKVDSGFISVDPKFRILIFPNQEFVFKKLHVLCFQAILWLSDHFSAVWGCFGALDHFWAGFGARLGSGAVLFTPLPVLRL